MLIWGPVLRASIYRLLSVLLTHIRATHQRQISNHFSSNYDHDSPTLTLWIDITIGAAVAAVIIFIAATFFFVYRRKTMAKQRNNKQRLK